MRIGVSQQRPPIVGFEAAAARLKIAAPRSQFLGVVPDFSSLACTGDGAR